MNQLAHTSCRRPALKVAAVLAALLLPAATGNAQSLGDVAPPGFASPQEVRRLGEQITSLRAQVDDAQKAQKAAVQRAEQAEAAARRAQEGVRRGGTVDVEQVEALKRERDTARGQLQAAREEVAELKQALTRAQAEARRASQASLPDPAVKAEGDRLRGDVVKLRREVSTLKDQLAAAQCAAAPVAIAPPVAASAAGLAGASASPGLPPDLSDIAVQSCATFPAFVLLPSTGPLTLGSGRFAITAEFSHRIAMGRTEVTVGQWKAFWNAPDRDYEPVKSDGTNCNWNNTAISENDRWPVSCVNVADVEAYIRWFNRRHAAALAVALGVPKQRLQVALPTDLEWEVAARGGRWTQAYLWTDGASDSEKCRLAQIYPCPGGVGTVGTRGPNGYGLYDMIGNLDEWTASPNRHRTSIERYHDPGKVPAGADVDPGFRGVRGGSYGSTDSGPGHDHLRLDFNGGYPSGLRQRSLGFRLVVRIAQ